MRHLRLVQDEPHKEGSAQTEDSPPAKASAPHATERATETASDDPLGEIDLEKMKPSPKLQKMFSELDEMFAGLTPAQQMDATFSMYFDANGKPRARSLNRLELAE